MSSFVSPSSNALRARLRAERRALTPAVRRRAAVQAARHLLTRPLFRNARRIAFYLAADGELDPLPLAHHATALGKRCYLPVLHPQGHRRLWFAPWRPGEPLRPNRYGIPEPLWERSGPVHLRVLDLVLLPLVAFDDRCNRMGMGAGFYDRTFAWKLRRPRWDGPRLVGYAYEMQQVAALDARAWDVPLDMVVTESGILCCEK